MTKHSKIREGMYTVAFMFVITLVTVSAVSGLHIATSDLVRRNNQLFVQKAILKAARVNLPGSAQEISKLYNERVSPADDSGQRFNVSGEVPAVALLQSGPGMWGDITAVVCFESATMKLIGVTFTEHSETPGLGARIEEEWFQEQFRGKTGRLKLQPEGTRSKRHDEVDGITGASITSKAVRDLANRALAEAETASRQKVD